MPTKQPERDRSKPYSQQVTEEIICDECGRVIMRKFMTGPRQSTDIGPPRWITRQKQASPGTYETWMCTPCVNELVPEENQAYNITSRSESE